MTATAVAAAVSVLPAPANAAPNSPNNASDAVKQLRDLSHQAEQLTEEWKQAQEEHGKRQADLDRATGEAEQAQQVADQARVEERKFRGRVDQFASASFEGARLNKLSALLISKSPHDFLDRASALDVLARDNNEAVQRLADARAQSEEAENRARGAQARAGRAAADAARLENEIGQRKAGMDRQIQQVKSRLAELSAAERSELQGGGETNYQLGPASGVGAQAAQKALSKQGSSYVWGAKGPSSFDCSGLIYWAYQQVGVSVPASSKAQAQAGKSVSKSQLAPGDLVAYYSPVSHIGIYVGNGKVVHAPTEGDVVKVSDMESIGNITAMRRVA